MPKRSERARANGGFGPARSGAGELGGVVQQAAKANHWQADPLLKTRLCRFFSAGEWCRHGADCQFAHGQEELRPLRHTVATPPELFNLNSDRLRASFTVTLRWTEQTPLGLSVVISEGAVIVAGFKPKSAVEAWITAPSEMTTLRPRGVC